MPKNKSFVTNINQAIYTMFLEKGFQMYQLDSFQIWIKAFPTKELAKKLKEDPVTVWKWYAGLRAPKPKVALKIIKLSGLTWKDIYFNYAIGKRTRI